MAYVLGFFAADGNMIKNRRGAHFVAFYSNDRKLIADVRSALGSNHKIGKRIYKATWSATYQLQIGSKEIFTDLLSLRMKPAKSQTLCLPSVPPKFQGDFVRGYFDGDGCIYFKKHWVKARKKSKWIFTTRFTSGSRSLLASLLRLLRNRGLERGFIVEKYKKSGYELIFSHRDSVALFRFMYDTVSDNGLYLARKYEKYQLAIRTLYGKYAGVAQR